MRLGNKDVCDLPEQGRKGKAKNIIDIIFSFLLLILFILSKSYRQDHKGKLFRENPGHHKLGLAYFVVVHSCASDL